MEEGWLGGVFWRREVVFFFEGEGFFFLGEEGWCGRGGVFFFFGREERGGVFWEGEECGVFFFLRGGEGCGVFFFSGRGGVFLFFGGA